MARPIQEFQQLQVGDHFRLRYCSYVKDSEELARLLRDHEGVAPTRRVLITLSPWLPVERLSMRSTDRQDPLVD